MTNLPTIKEEIKYKIKIIWGFLNELLGNLKVVERTGLYFRRKVLKPLSLCNSCILRAHRRKFFSAARSTIQNNPDDVRREFVESIKSSHLPLVVRGNGNYSLRFFEVLSLGRVPLFVDTDTPLPLEDEIDYDSFMLRVDHKDISDIDKIISEFWKKTSDEKFIEMQKKARTIFENHLRTDVFYKIFFS